MSDPGGPLENPLDRLVAVPTTGRTFTAQRRARFGDLDPSGQLRLDSVARYLQDVSSDDTTESRLRNDVYWVVRKLAIEVHSPIRFREMVDLTTWCSGIGSHWAERRVQMIGAKGGHIETGVLWVHIDANSGCPVKLDDQFVQIYDESTGGRRVRSRLSLPHVAPAHSVDNGPWPVRFTDFDLLGHMNNAAYWSAVEQVRSTRPQLSAPLRAEVEYRAPIEPGRTVQLRSVDHGDDAVTLWLTDPSTEANRVYAAARVGPLSRT